MTTLRPFPNTAPARLPPPSMECQTFLSRCRAPWACGPHLGMNFRSSHLSTCAERCTVRELNELQGGFLSFGCTKSAWLVCPVGLGIAVTHEASHTGVHSPHLDCRTTSEAPSAALSKPPTGVLMLVAASVELFFAHVCLDIGLSFCLSFCLCFCLSFCLGFCLECYRTLFRIEFATLCYC